MDGATAGRRNVKETDRKRKQRGGEQKKKKSETSKV